MAADPLAGKFTALESTEIGRRFEANWRAGRSPRIEDELQNSDSATGDELFRNLLTIELENRRLRGDRLSTVEYKNRFPDRASSVVAVFRVLAERLKSNARDSSVQHEGRQHAGPAPSPSPEMLDPKQVAAVVAHEREHMVATVEAVLKKRRKPWWLWVGASVCLGLLTIGAFAMFGRTPTATVVLKLDLDLTDASLSYFLDEKPIDAAKLAGPIDLPLGRHELTVNRGATVLRRFEFNVTSSGGPVQLVELPPPLSDDPDRAAAELVQLLGGSVSIAPLATTFYGPTDRLPDGPCKPVAAKLGSIELSLANLEVLSRAGSLRALDFGSLAPDAWEKLAGMINLEELDIGTSNLTEADIDRIARLGRLKKLSITGPSVNDKTLEKLTPLKNLESLNISGSAVGNAGLMHLTGMPLLELHLRRTTVSNAATPSLRRLRKLRRLDLIGTRYDNDGVANIVDRMPECWVSPPLVVPADVAAAIADLEMKLARNPNGYSYHIHNGLRHNYWLAKNARKREYHADIILRNEPMHAYILGCCYGHGTDKQANAKALLGVSNGYPEYRFLTAACRIKAAEFTADKNQARQLLQGVIDTPGKDLDQYHAEARKRLAALK